MAHGLDQYDRMLAQARILPAYPYNDRHCCLYEIPDNPPTKQQGRKLSNRLPGPGVALHRTREVQYEA